MKIRADLDILDKNLLIKNYLRKQDFHLNNHRVIEILKTFSKDETVRFGEFICSPYFNKSEKLIKFYKALMKYYPLFQFKSYTGKRLHQTAYPGNVFNKNNINKLFFDLLKAAENYLKIKNFQEEEIQGDDFLRFELQKRNLHKLAELNIKKNEALLNQVKDLEYDYYINCFKLISDKINCMYQNKKRNNKSLIMYDASMISDRSRYITFLFVTEVIRNYDNLLTINKTYEINKDREFTFGLFKNTDFPALIKYLIENPGNEKYADIFRIYLSLLNMFSDFENERHYFEYKKLLFANLDCFALNEKRFHAGRLVRYCMLKRADENNAVVFGEELFKVYNFILESGLYKTILYEFMPLELYRSILFLGLILKKYVWTIKFIKKYIKFIKPDIRKNLYHFSLAEYYFRRKMYKSAIEHFHKVTFDEFIFKIDLKNLMLMCYYETKQYESALSLIYTYEQFLSKDKTISADQRRRYKNFIDSVKKLVLYRASAGNESTLSIEISLNKDFPNKDWVREKLIEIPQKRKKAV